MSETGMTSAYTNHLLNTSLEAADELFHVSLWNETPILDEGSGELISGCRLMLPAANTALEHVPGKSIGFMSGDLAGQYIRSTPWSSGTG